MPQLRLTPPAFRANAEFPWLRAPDFGLEAPVSDDPSSLCGIRLVADAGLQFALLVRAIRWEHLAHLAPGRFLLTQLGFDAIECRQYGLTQLPPACFRKSLPGE